MSIENRELTEIPEESQEDLNQNNKPQKISRRGFLKATAGAIIGSSALGEAAEVFVGENEEVDDSKPDILLEEKEIIVRDKKFLKKYLVEISESGTGPERSGVGVSEEGNMIIHNKGSRYYEIDKAGLDKLIKSSRGQRERIRMREIDVEHSKTKKEKEDAEEMLEKTKKMVKDFFSQKIEDLGKKLSFDELPENLNKFEKERLRKEKSKK